MYIYFPEDVCLGFRPVFLVRKSNWKFQKSRSHLLKCISECMVPTSPHDCNRTTLSIDLRPLVDSQRQGHDVYRKEHWRYNFSYVSNTSDKIHTESVQFLVYINHYSI